jgi:hypothetical protein
MIEKRDDVFGKTRALTGRLSLASLLDSLCLRAARQFILRVLLTHP